MVDLILFLIVYVLYKESDNYLNYIPNIIMDELLEYSDDYLFNNIFIRKGIKYEIIKKDIGIQCDLAKDIDDMVIL
jgi:phage anti-repressor protein